MEDILENVKSLDNGQLREKFQELGIKVGPITPTTKTLFQKRLAKAIFEEKTGNVSTPSDTEEVSYVKEESQVANKIIDTASEVFFAVCLPELTDPDISKEVSQLVFSDKDLALKTAKKVKGSRFKVFKSQLEAEEFSKLTAENTFSSPLKVSKDGCNKEAEMSTESVPYKAPRPQELFIARKMIEKGEVKQFLDCIWNNPRYLISSGDTPVIYHEGFHYSAMHIAAMKNQAEICRAILDTLEDRKFMQQLYCQTKHTEESLNKTINFLVDLYLNMPDSEKGNCESPLHMACKFGYEEVVRVLATHPKTDKYLKNKWGRTPKELICTRSYDALTSTISKIGELLQGQYYVPLIRSYDNSTQPVIGQPWSPDISKSHAGITSLSSLSPSPKDPVLSVRACAGPMSQTYASHFHKKWTTPPSESPEKARLYVNTKRGDCEKGMERIGRYLAHEMKIPWIEHWDFLDSYADLSTSEGLDALEEYFKKSVWLKFIKEFKDRHGIEEIFQDLTEVSSPIKAKSCDIVKQTMDGCSVSGINGRKDFVVVKDTVDIDYPNTNGDGNGCLNDETPSSDDDKLNVNVDSKPTVVEKGQCDSPLPGSRTSSQSSSDILSPITSLSQSFAQLSVLDDSLTDNSAGNKFDTTTSDQDDKKNNNLNDIKTKLADNHVDEIKADVVGNNQEENAIVSKEQETNIDNLRKTGTVVSSNNELIDNKSDGNYTPDITNHNEEMKTQDIDKTDSKTEEIVTALESVCSTDLKESVLQTDSNAVSTTGQTIIAETQDKSTTVKDGAIHGNSNQDVNGIEESSNSAALSKTAASGSQSDSPLHMISDIGRKHLLSDRYDSTSSFKTAEEDIYESSLNSPFSDVSAVCINLNYSPSLSTLKEELDNRNLLDSDPDMVCLLVRFKKLPVNGQMKFDVVLYPTGNDINQVVLVEDVEVFSCDGNISAVSDGEVVDVCFTHKGEEVKLKAHFVRSVNLAKPAYIHGCEPSREDLDVFRALGNTTVSPEYHPNVFHWKINLSRYCSDKKYRWQSPAKLKMAIKGASPQASPQRKTSPVVPYGSPIGYGYGEKKSLVSPDIRTRLFSNVTE